MNQRINNGDCSRTILLEASHKTNFVYEIESVTFSKEQLRHINSINTQAKIKDRISEIQQLNGCFNFVDIESKMFMNNLVLIDSFLPQITSEALKLFFTTNLASIKDITILLERNNPLKFNTENNHRFYEYKLKRLLAELALGMGANENWSKKRITNRGYSFPEGDKHLATSPTYSEKTINEYLFNNSQFEIANAIDNNSGTIENYGDKWIFKLNLQISLNNKQ